MLSAFKNFFVTLLIAFVIFGVAAYFASMFVTDTMNDILSSEKEQLDHIIENENEGASVPLTPPEENDPFADIEGESFSLLITVTDYRPDLYSDYLPVNAEVLNERVASEDPYEGVGILSADYREAGACAMVLAVADKEQGKFTYTYLSTLTRVYTPTGYHTLGKVYNYYGGDSLAGYVHALTGIEADYTMVIRGHDLDEFVNYLGGVSVEVGKDIYFDGREYTTHYEYTKDAVDEEGVPYVAHIPNTFALGAGTVGIDSGNIYTLASLKERSMGDISVKEAYTVAAVKAYLTKLAAMDDTGLIAFVETLTPNLPDQVEAVPEESTETAAPDPANPWWTSDGVSEGTENVLFEPDTDVIETTFNTGALERIKGVLRAAGLFTHTTVSYPGSYVPAAEGSDAYFEPDTKKGIELLLPVRLASRNTAETTAE